MKNITILISVLMLFVGACKAESKTIKSNISEQTDSISTEFKTFLAKFPAYELPYTIDSLSLDTTLLALEVNKYLDVELETNQVVIETFYPGSIFYNNEFIGIIYIRFFSPGGFGINNYFIELVTINYKGEVIDTEELSCFCSDTNLGINDHYYSEAVYHVSDSEIIINDKYIHKTLFPEESDAPFNTETQESFKIAMSKIGNLIKSKE